MRCELEIDNKRLANVIYGRLLSKCRIRDLMKTIRENPDRDFYIVVKKSDPLNVEIVGIKSNSSGIRCEMGDTIVIPIPKRFAILEPDENYFRQTLKANIFLVLNGASEKELHL